MDKPKKPLARLKVPFRFLATPTMMATIPKGWAESFLQLVRTIA